MGVEKVVDKGVRLGERMEVPAFAPVRRERPRAHVRPSGQTGCVHQGIADAVIAADRAGEGRPVPRWYVVLVQRDVIAENLQDEGRQLTVRGELRLDSAEAPYGRPERVVRGEMSVSASRAG